MQNNKLALVTFGILINSIASTPVFARPEFVKMTGAKDCTVCHFDNAGRNPWKPGVLDTYFKDGIPGLITFVKKGGSKDTAPVLSPINAQWDVTINETPLDIPFHVFDKENDTFTLHGSIPMAGAKLSELHIDKASNLPTQILHWKPVSADAKKIYTISIYATENGTARTLKSNTVTAEIFVWPARSNAKTAQVQDFKISTARWHSGQLTLSGQITFKSTVSIKQQIAALKTLTLQLKSSSGLMVSSPLTLKPNKTGSWTNTIALTATQVPCVVIGNYEGLNTSRVVSSASATCLK